MAHQASATIVKLVQIGEVHQLSNFARGYWALNFPPRAGKFSSFPVSVRFTISTGGYDGEIPFFPVLDGEKAIFCALNWLLIRFI